MSPHPPLTAFQLLCVDACRFISDPALTVREIFHRVRVVDLTDSAAVYTARPAADTQSKAPSKKTKAAPCSKAAGAKMGEQILKVVADGSDRKVMSLATINKALLANGIDVEKYGSQIRFTIKRNVTNGSLKQIQGTGASGSFKVAEKETTGKVRRKVKQSPAKKSPGNEINTKQTSTKKAPMAKKTAKAMTGKKATAKKPKSPKKATGAKVNEDKKEEKPRAKATPKSAKSMKAALKK